MKIMEKAVLFWFRRDLRMEDNHGLYCALKSGLPVVPLFIFDREILDRLNSDDQRVPFIHQEIQRLQEECKLQNSSMLVEYGYPEQIFEKLLKEGNFTEVHTNEDYEPYALERDEIIKNRCEEKDVDFFTYKDHVIFHKDDILKDDGDPYSVFTPYSKKWKAHVEEDTFEHYSSEEHLDALWKPEDAEDLSIPELSDMGFSGAEVEYPSRTVKQSLIKQYADKRNLPAEQGTSRLGLHFRFGTISIREKARRAKELSESFLNELIWRDFYSMVLYQYPHVVDGPFRKKYEDIPWRNNEDEFEKWKKGMTGIPMVDAGMRQLNETGYMHNRVRMIVASFLTKNLLINWQWGEAYFAEKLLDYELASNNGGWQWAAGTGTDAAPYFRIFNPLTQQKKFDKNNAYVCKWIPELNTDDYPGQMVDLKESRKRCLEAYKSISD